MISRETFSRMATSNQTTEINLAHEYCQHLFLSAFYRQKGSERVMFKGGTALKIVYGSPRFSEDLDFSGFGVTSPQIEDWILETVGEIEMNAIGVEIQESKLTSGGYLAILGCRLYDYLIQIQVEISLRQQNDVQGQGTLIAPDYLPAYTLTLLPQTRLVEEKISALLTRGKPRDFFDLYFLLRKGLITPEMKPHLLPIQDMLPGLTMNFYSELAQFLPASHLGVLRDFPTALSGELKRHGV
ncbi:MAG: nucleotidyl transferase AbiEii/AbiGii toxin family protein [Chloroflexi bacterium]|nr:nucleotidyl transferase AbiEii/AbiGii toxin family protein [Chloroflexota bacterium]